MLNRILSRILPLRSTDGIQDKIVFLGDYIDRHQDSHLVLDKMIEIKAKYGDNIICLIGNHELLFLEAMDLTKTFKYNDIGPREAHNVWMFNGGLQTLTGYFDALGIQESPWSFPRRRLIDVIPDNHIEFMLTKLEPYYEDNDYIFVHAGMDLSKPVAKNSLKTLTWDRGLFGLMKRGNPLSEKIKSLDKCLITGHNHRGPIITDNYMMLDCGAPKQMLLCELNSMGAFMVYPNKNRMISYEMKQTYVPKPTFRRVK
jgi:serine/threonine protein phosphatase 1